MASDLIQVISVAPERKYTKVYHDFLYSDLSAEEKLVYIALKTFVEFGKDGDSVWPTMETLSKLASMSVPRARRAINKLVAKGYVKKKRRGLKQPNLYEICDVAEIWKTDNEEAISQIIDRHASLAEFSDEEIRAEAKRRNIIETKKEGLDSAATDQSPEDDLENIFSDEESTKDSPISQAGERYSMAEIHSHFGYEAVTAVAGDEDTDAVFDVLYDALNTTKVTLRVGGENLPREAVIGRLMKLEYSDIIYVIQQYNDQTGRITNQTAYILTQLYRARAQSHLDLMNEGHHNGDF